ncbi:MAG: hypothetical protein U1C74_12865, partial [Phenylobacterium sp.]|nr:hypothetical protein [Phenylobacterium sp.]
MRHWTQIAAAACMLTTSACASGRLSLPAAPRLEMPPQARRPCDLHRLPDVPTVADLEIGYAAR